jgi:hypothetical protein
MKTITALGLVLVALGSLTAPPAMADPDLEGSIEALACPDAVNPGAISVLGPIVAIPPGTPVTLGPLAITCTDLQVGFRVKVGCTDATCATAAYIEVSPVSAESSIAIVGCAGICFQLTSDVACFLTPGVRVQQNKNFLGLPDTKPKPKPTPTDLVNFLTNPATVPGVTPGTLEVQCEGLYVPGAGIFATTVHLKK